MEYLQAILICAVVSSIIVGIAYLVMNMYLSFKDEEMYSMLKRNSKNLRMKMQFPSIKLTGYSSKNTFDYCNDLQKGFFDE